MKKVKKYAKVLLGCVIISLSLNVFFVNQDIFPAGIFGLSTLFSSRMELDVWLPILITNIIFIFLCFIGLSKNKCKRTVLSFALIPFLCYITRDIGRIIDLSGVDNLLVTIYGGFTLGLGCRFIYKENRLVSGSDVISVLEEELAGVRYNIINYLLDAALIGVTIFFYGFETAMYSLISIIIIEFLSKRASLGTSDSKVFYIITKKDKEVRSYIIDDLHYACTIFDVKGGFLKTKNTILMTVIPTTDYYRLRSGVRMIDDKAFISITDSYEVINGSKNKLDKNS